MLTVLIVATVLVAIAELGDKTQILVLSLAARFSAKHVLLGVFAAVVVLQFIATAAGCLVGGVIPQDVLRVVTGVLFVGFGVVTLRSARKIDETEEVRAPSRFGPVLTTFAAFFLAELGDKTQIVAMTVAADPGAALGSLGALASSLPAVPTGAAAFWGVWIGSVLGMLIADGLAIGVGALIGKRLPERLITRVSGIVF
ncbi:MAG TPA: TMEM165/GDT1 family protein, partial [Coriobacteriia bacterium]|nr:TMEM165/GDT1 family protein [Coriobacteriia bacterium]